MPIEVRELTIKARVESSSGDSQTAHAGAGAKIKEAEINMIVDKVLRILKERTER